jgi:Tfp pilus assembly protein PilO
VKTKNIAVGALAALLTLALWWNFLLKPARSEASKVKADTEVQKTKLAPLEAQLAQANADAAHAGDFKTQLAALKRAVPEAPALAAWIRAANTTAVAANLTWQSVTHGPPTIGADGVWSIALGIQVRGTYEETIDYLSRLSQLTRLVVIDNIVFSAAGSTGAGAGTGAGGGSLSTGPFTGANELTVTITARMFEIPVGADPSASGTATTAGTTPAATGAAAGTPTSQAASLNNS